MAYTMTAGDRNVVNNIRYKHGDAVKTYPDEHIAKTWREFSGSDEYPDEDKFLEWLAFDRS